MESGSYHCYHYLEYERTMISPNERSDMQGGVFMPLNPQQGFSPSTPPTATEMDVMNQKEASTNRSSDSGIFSTTNNTTQQDSDSHSDCSTPERKYFCPICDKTSTSQHEFTLHIRSHNNENNEIQDNDKQGYTCKICSKVLSSGSSLDRHVLVHSGERPFHCKYCGDTFTTNGNMHRHMRTHKADNNNYESDSGGSTDTSSSKSTEFNNNKIERNNKRKNVDPPEPPLKKQHNEDEEDETYQCPICERNDFNSLSILETHLEDNHPEYPTKCNQCKLTFPNYKQLQQHKLQHSPTPKQPVIGFKDLTFVDFSSEKFPHIARIECETNLHKVQTGLKFQCNKCNRAFPCVNSLEIHESNCLNNIETDVNNHLNQGEIKRMEFFSRLNLVDKPLEETQPPPNNNNNNKLREHLIKQLDNNNSKDLADIQSILSNINLIKPEEHTNVSKDETRQDHQEEESQDLFAVEFRKMKLRGEFPCRLCTAVFPNLRALKGHNRAHLNGTTNGTYHCNMCPHSSLDKAALIRHMRTHNGDRPYECSLCNYAFTTKANCERHLRNRHSKTTREEVKKSIIYHPSEDPTNEDLNKLTSKDDCNKKIYSPRMYSSTPKLETRNEDVQPLKPPPKMFPTTINDIIRNDNLHMRGLNQDNLPYNLTQQTQACSKIQVKNIETMKERIDNNSYEDECVEEEDDEQPLDLVLDLSKKKKEEPEEQPQDLTKKPIQTPVVDQMLGQPFLKSPPKIDPAALYATQLALYRGSFGHWPGFPVNPLLFPAFSHDIKERIQRFQLCGGSMISEHTPQPFPLPPKKIEDMKPLNVDTTPTIPQPPPPPPPQPKQQELLQSPNSVKMVIKNGVLMPKQKQRRYRTERPFTCEHCSARFTLRSNMERHIKQQHPQYWSQRQRGSISTPGRKPQIMPMKPNFCDLSIPNFEPPNKDFLNEKLKFAILAQQLKTTHTQQQTINNNNNINNKLEDDEDCALIIDENNERDKTDIVDNDDEEEIDVECNKDGHNSNNNNNNNKVKNEESQDLVPVARLLDNASQQQFREFFKREGEEHEVGLVSEEDEEGLVASGSTSEGNVSGTDENRSESETTPQPVKKKSAYSLAPNRVSCPYCSRKFPWTSSLRRHILTHTGQKPFKCSHCPLLFTTKSNCDRHLLRKHGNAATTIPNESANSNYLMRNVPERPFKCSSCPSSTFSTYSNLKKHISCKHSTNAQGDDIKAQGYEAGSSEDEKVSYKLENWDKVNSESSVCNNNSDLPFKCHLCEGSFSERQDALDHIKTKHLSEYELLMQKNALDTNATTPEDIQHQDDDDGELRGKFPDYSNRKVICAFCMRRFWSAEDLRRHMRTHTGERPFSCDICRRRFTLKHSMLRHRKKHNVNFEFDTNNSDEDAQNNVQTTKTSSESESGDLISNLLGLRDRSIIDKVLTASADDAAKLLGVRNGVKE